MGAIGQLDHDDAQVAHHGQQHLAEALGLGFFAALELDLVELGDAIDDLGDIAAEARGDVFLGDGRVFDDVVQNRADQGVGIEVQVSEDFGRSDRMRDIGLAGEALLALMGDSPELSGVANPLYLIGWQVEGDLGEEFGESRSAPGA